MKSLEPLNFVCRLRHGDAIGITAVHRLAQRDGFRGSRTPASDGGSSRLQPVSSMRLGCQMTIQQRLIVSGIAVMQGAGGVIIAAQE
jgi:hypothetical protein